MGKWKALAILFAVISVGAIKKSFRILTSADADIANNRASLIPMAVIMTGVFIFFTIKFWRKSTGPKEL